MYVSSHNYSLIIVIWATPDPENHQLMHSLEPGQLAFPQGFCIYNLVISLGNLSESPTSEVRN